MLPRVRGVSRCFVYYVWMKQNGLIRWGNDVYLCQRRELLTQLTWSFWVSRLSSELWRFFACPNPVTGKRKRSQNRGRPAARAVGSLCDPGTAGRRKWLSSPVESCDSTKISIFYMLIIYIFAVNSFRNQSLRIRKRHGNRFMSSRAVTVFCFQSHFRYLLDACQAKAGQPLHKAVNTFTWDA